MQLSSKKYMNGKRTLKLGEVTIGGETKNNVMITGPCSVESEEQITACAELCVELGVKVLRAGCYKPRTSPYSFQGMGLDGLKLLARMREKYGLAIITEVRDSTHIDDIIEYSDIVQIGAKAMYDQGILRKCGSIQKPILLKRGFGTTLQEFVQASEFILSGGNPNVALCERGIRTFETKTRFTLDLCGVAYLKEYTNLPIILDPSHAMGYAYGVADLTRACTAMGIDGLLIETHPNPKVAKSDASQQLNFEEFRNLYKSIEPVAKAVGYQIV
jgi:3-deoxy-7-phosphoheptulonate synthase